MSGSRKFGQLKLDGASPMAFVEMGEVPGDPWTEAEETTARTVGRAIKRYVEAATELANGRYQPA